MAAAGARNLAKWLEKHPEGGGLKHGARSRHIRARYSDGRTREGKQLRAIIQALSDDLGDLSAGQVLILDRIREKLVVLLQIGKYVDRQPSIVDAEGSLLPCLGRGYTTYAESLRRDIELCYTLAARRPAKTLDLHEYLKQKRSEGDGP